jgi:hypothetical protein
MRVMITRPPGIFAEGPLQSVISEQDAPEPHIVIKMSVDKVDNPVEVTLDARDLSTIVRLAKGSTVQEIRDAVR